MKIPQTVRHQVPMCTRARRLIVALTACHTNDRDEASQMTSFSAQCFQVGDSASSSPFRRTRCRTCRWSRIEPTTMKRTLRLTGTVAYNAFNTTPVITQVGGPVSRILVVPGDACQSGSTHA